MGKGARNRAIRRACGGSHLLARAVRKRTKEARRYQPTKEVYRASKITPSAKVGLRRQRSRVGEAAPLQPHRQEAPFEAPQTPVVPVRHRLGFIRRRAK
jgi:hypothetical protein